MEDTLSLNEKYKKALILVIVINATMFLVEFISSYLSDSTSLLADSIDFLTDAANYCISIWVINKSLQTKSKASLIKGICLLLFAIGVMANTGYKMFLVTLPKAEVMGIVGMLALLANVVSAYILYRFKKGDVDRMSIWLISMNDAIANLGVILAGVAVYLTASKWPDIIAAMIIVAIQVYSAYKIISASLKNLR